MVFVDQTVAGYVPASQTSAIDRPLRDLRMWEYFANPPSLILRRLLPSRCVTPAADKGSHIPYTMPLVPEPVSPQPFCPQQPRAVRPSLVHQPASSSSQPGQALRGCQDLGRGSYSSGDIQCFEAQDTAAAQGCHGTAEERAPSQKHGLGSVGQLRGGPLTLSSSFLLPPGSTQSPCQAPLGG